METIRDCNVENQQWGSHSLGTLIEWKLVFHTFNINYFYLFPLAGDINWMETEVLQHVDGLVR